MSALSTEAHTCPIAGQIKRRDSRGRARCARLLGVGALVCALLLLGASAAFATPPSSALRYSYDGLGQLKSATDPAGTTAIFHWDPVGNLLSIGNQPAGALALTQVAPNSAAVGASVTLYGTGFDSNPANDSVSFNGTAASVSSASASQLVVTVPSGASTGPVSVTTPAGTVTSDSAFTVVSGLSISAVAPSVVSAGDSVTVSGSSFDPSASSDNVLVNQTRVALASASASSLSLAAPAVGSGPVSVSTSTGQAAGPDLFIAPAGHVAGDVTYTGRMSIGASKTVSIATGGKLGLVVFDGNAGQQLSISTSGKTFSGTPSISIESPDGSTLVSPQANSFIDQFRLSRGGTYTIVVDSTNAGGGSITLTLNDASDATTSVTPTSTGASASLSTTVPGQNMAFTFSGTAGEVVAFQEGYPSSVPNYVSLRKPDGTNLWGPTYTGSPLGYYWSDKLVALPTTGTYTVYSDPSGTLTSNSTSMTVYAVPPDLTATLSPSTSGSSTTVTTSPAQNAVYTFSGAAGQRVSLTTSGSTYRNTPNISIVNPDGSTLVSPSTYTFMDAATLPTSGTYKIVVDPQQADSGHMTLTAWDATDATTSVTPSASGGSASLSTTVPGENMAFTFSGTAGEVVAFQEGYPSSVPNYISLRKPDGTNLTGPTYAGPLGYSWTDKVTLPTTGTYTVYSDPTGTATSSSTSVTVYAVPPDATGTVTPSSTGSSASVSMSPGQNASVTFSGTAGQRVSLTTSNSTYSRSPNISILKPDGSTLVSPSTYTFVDAVTLPTTGTYKIVVDPQYSDAGSLTLTAWDAADATTTVTPATFGGSGSLATTAPGQNMAFTFSETAGHTLAFQVQYPGSVTNYLSLRKPDGTTMWGPTFAGSLGAYWVDKTTMPSTGTYTIYSDPTGTLTSSSTSVTVYDVPPDVSGTLVIGGAAQAFSTSPAQNASFTFSAPANKTIHLTFSRVSATSTWAITDPSGATVTSGSVASGSTLTVTATLATAGAYKVAIDPQGAARAAMLLTLTDPPGFSPPVVRETTVPRIYAGAPFITDFPPGGRALRCAPPARGACAHTAGAQHPVYRPVSDVRLAATIGGRAVDVVTREVGQKADVSFDGLAHGKVGLRVDSLSEPGYLFVFKPDGRKLLAPRLIGKGGGTLSLRLSQTGTYLAVWFPRRPGRSFARFQLLAVRPHAARHALRPACQPARNATAGRHGLMCATSQRHTASPAQDTSSGAIAVPRIPFHPSTPATWTPSAANIHGDWMTGRSRSSWENAGQLQASAGQTALAGQALQLDGTPLADVTMSIKGTTASVRTDRAGRFLLQGVSGGHHVLVIDGSTVHRAGRRYGYFTVGVDLQAGKTIDLGYPVWMTQLDPAGDARIPDPTTHDVVLTTPRIPGLEVRIPAGSTIRDHAGHLVRSLNITQVPVDRPPFPLPLDIRVPLYFTVQPGGAYLSKGAQIIYPNYSHLPAGQRVDFWNYDPDSRGWYIYGRGTVSPNAKQVIPDPDVRVWEFTGAMISSTFAPPGSAPPPGGGPSGGDPVDLSSGLFVYKKTDLVVPDSSMPIVVRRTYRPNDSNSYSFGVGTQSNFDMHLWSVTNYTAADLVLSDGSRVHYVRTSSGTGWNDAVYQAQNAPGPFYHSTISWDNSVPPAGGWDLRTQDGTIYKFPDNAPLQSIVDRFGNTLTITRAGGSRTGNITKLTTPHGRWVSFSYDASNRITQATDNAGRTVSYSYDASGHLASATDPVGHTTSYSYDSNGNMTVIHDARGHDFLTNTYDANGLLSQQTMADGAVYQFQFVPNRTLTGIDHTIVTQPNGQQDVHYFDGTGREVSVTRDAQGPAPQTTISRDSNSNLTTSVTDPLGNVTNYTYDADGRPTAITRMAGTPNAVTTQLTYDPLYGQATSVTDPLGHTITYSYDSQGRLRTVTDPTGRTTTYSYANGDDQPTSIKDPAGKITSLAYFAGDLTRITDPLGNTISRSYDAAGRLVSSTDAVGDHTSYSYDGDNELTQTTDPAGGTTSFSYDADGNLLQIQDARADRTTMTYDPLGRMLTRRDGLNRTASYSYDHDGNLVLATDRRGITTAYHYNGLDQRTFAGYGASDAQGDSPYQDSVSYTYDAGGELLQAADSNAGTFSYGYDGLGRTTSTTTPDGSVAYGYDAASRLTSIAANATLTSYGYDNANRLASVTQGSQTASLGYDGDGRRSTLTLPNGIVQTNTYDDASRLTDVQYGLGSTSVGDLHYAFDPAGHRIAAWGSLARTSIPAPVGSASYDAANERTSRDGQTLLYDADGNLLSDGTTTYGWDAQGRLASTAGPGLNVSYAYDPFGTRIGKTVNGTATRYLWAGPNVAQELTGGLTSATMMSTPGVDDLLARTTTSGGTSSYLTDPLGSVLALTDGTGAATTSYTYGPFGETSSTGASSDNPYQFTSRENDGNGLDYNRARYYSPTNGTFLSEDPAGMAASGTNLYRYANNDPTDGIDPTGLSFWNDVGNAIGSVVPRPVSDFSAGVLDGAFWGAPSAILGIPHACWAGTLHGAGQLVGAVAPGARISFGISAVLGAERGLIGTALAGATGGAAAGAYTAMGTGSNPAQGAVIGLSGGAGGALGYLGELGGNGAAAAATAGGATIDTTVDMGSALATGGGATSGVKDGC